MAELDFADIAPRLGSQTESFEELCCQIARRKSPSDARFFRLHGAGGDGGVECFAILPSGEEVGWQAKFVFDVDNLLTQLTKSLETALEIHKTLHKYIVCFPFNLTGPTGRSGKSGKEKFEEWRKEQEKAAAAKGRSLSIVDWSATTLRSEILSIDPNGGLRAFFFNATVLSKQWFDDRLREAIAAAGPRYTPELNVETPLWKWFGAFGRTKAWVQAFGEQLNELREVAKQFFEAVGRSGTDTISASWPNELRGEGTGCASSVTDLIQRFTMPSDELGSDAARQIADDIDEIAERLNVIESQLVDQLEKVHGKGNADSPGFRQFMAEYNVSFPAANLDTTRELIKSLNKMREWLMSPAGWLAFESTFVLLGIAGSGKTHGVCDVAVKRYNEGLLSLVLFGHQFSGNSDPWARFSECLGFPSSLGKDGVLHALNSAGEASGNKLIICIDALNETRPLRYWHDNLAAFVEATKVFPFLRVCVTCRNSFAPYCVPVGTHGAAIFYEVEHEGFSGIEREACTAFFNHYGLEPPATPMLQPELANPLYLKLICTTLQSQGLTRLPAGWAGMAQAIKAFLAEKERQFALAHGVGQGSAIVAASLSAVIKEIVRRSEASLAWSVAEKAIHDERPAANGLNLIQWLIHEDLLIDDAPIPGTTVIDPEHVVRPAFERLGDFLIARELLSHAAPSDLQTTSTTGNNLAPFLKSVEGIQNNNGIISAISILVPEEFVPGTELPDLFAAGEARSEILKITVNSYPWRDPAGFTDASILNLEEALALPDFSYNAMDAALAVSWQPCVIDAIWLHGSIARRPMTKRDAFWCGYLHMRYDEGVGPVHRLIDEAFKIPLDRVEISVIERWAIILLWFTAAADRRVKDRASRAVIELLNHHPALIPALLIRMIEVNDDAVRERVLLCIYAVAIRSQDASLTSDVCERINEALKRKPETFHHALLRDVIKAFAELIEKLGDAKKARATRRLLNGLKSDWPLQIPSDANIDKWELLPKLKHSCLDDDFFIYSMNCLNDWKYALPKKDMGKWILQRVAQDFGYADSGCEQYDRYMLGKHGGGRGRTKWADRIGKKYQWTALYQLAARLSDHIERKLDRWERPLNKRSFILLPERQFDPTLPFPLLDRERNRHAWWVPAKADISRYERLDDNNWVQQRDDVPNIAELLRPIEHRGQRWRVVQSYFNWRQETDDRDDPYREIWTHVEAYLVKKDVTDSAFQCFSGRNFFGQWLPQGASWIYGFAGEYPWGQAFVGESKDYRMGRSNQRLPYAYIPIASQVGVEWEYDASLPQNFHMNVPARILFKPGDLWWNGKNGHRLISGEDVFIDPSVTEHGPSALLADIPALADRLQGLGLEIIWTLIGEKWILGGRHDEASPRQTFSQAARLQADGSLIATDLKFFKDYDEAASPSPVKRKHGRVK